MDKGAPLPDLVELAERYGDGLGDYCLMLLGEDGAAAEVVRDVLIFARAHEDRLPTPDRLTPSGGSRGPNSTGPNLDGPNAGGSNVGGPNVGGSNVGGPNVGGPNVGGSNVGAPNSAGSNVSGPNVGGPSSRRLGGRGSGWRADPDRARAWLYAITRAHCATRPGRGSAFIGDLAVRSAGVSGGRDGRETGPLVAAGLQALDRRQREMLELSFRHGLDLIEVAAVMGQADDRVAAAYVEAQDVFEAWVNTVVLARTGRSKCDDGTDLAESWLAMPRRGPRTQLRVHVTECAICGKAANLTVTSSTLLAQLPLASLSLRQRDYITDPGGPPPCVTIEWTEDGFPVQPDAELELATPSTQAPVLTAGLRANQTTGFWDADDDDAAYETADPAGADLPTGGGEDTPREDQLPLSSRHHKANAHRGAANAHAHDPRSHSPLADDSSTEGPADGRSPAGSRSDGDGDGDGDDDGAGGRRVWPRAGRPASPVRPARRRNPYRDDTDNGSDARLGDLPSDTLDVGLDGLSSGRLGGGFGGVFDGASDGLSSGRLGGASDGASNGAGDGRSGRARGSAFSGGFGGRLGSGLGGASDGAGDGRSGRARGSGFSGRFGGRLGRGSDGGFGGGSGGARGGVSGGGLDGLSGGWLGRGLDGVSSGGLGDGGEGRDLPEALSGLDVDSDWEAQAPFPRRLSGSKPGLSSVGEGGVRAGKAMAIGSGVALLAGVVWTLFQAAPQPAMLEVAHAATAPSGFTSGSLQQPTPVPAPPGVSPTAAAETAKAPKAAAPAATENPGDGSSSRKRPVEAGVPGSGASRATGSPMRAEAGGTKRVPSPKASVRPVRPPASSAKVTLIASEGGRRSRQTQTIALRATGGAVSWRVAVSTPLLQLSPSRGVVKPGDGGGDAGFEIGLTPLNRLAADGEPTLQRLYLDCGKVRTAAVRIEWSGVSQSGVRDAGTISFRLTYRRPCP